MALHALDTRRLRCAAHGRARPAPRPARALWRRADNRPFRRARPICGISRPAEHFAAALREARARTAPRRLPTILARAPFPERPSDFKIR